MAKKLKTTETAPRCSGYFGKGTQQRISFLNTVAHFLMIAKNEPGAR